MFDPSKKTVKASRMVLVKGEAYELRTEDGVLSTDPSKLAIAYLLKDNGDREEVGRVVPAEVTSASTVVHEVAQRWFATLK
jgi:hypothetical protein